MPPVRVRVWFRVSVRIRVGGQLSSGAIVLEPKVTYRKLLSQIMKRSSFIFKENHVFIQEEDNPSDKVVTVDE